MRGDWKPSPRGSRSLFPRVFTPMLTRQYLMFMADGSTVISSVGEITRVKCNGQLGHVPHDEEDRPAVPWPRQVGGHTETGARHVASARGPSLPHRAGGRRPKGHGAEGRTRRRQVGAHWVSYVVFFLTRIAARAPFESSVCIRHASEIDAARPRQHVVGGALLYPPSARAIAAVGIISFFILHNSLIE